MVKKVVYKIEREGVNITEEIAKSFLRLTYHDESEATSDRVNIQLGGKQKHWKYADEVVISLGYEGEELFKLGTFTVFSSERMDKSGLEVVCTGVDFGSSFKVKRSTSYANVSISKIIKEIADRNGLKYYSDFDDVVFEYLAQSDESDMQFLRRLAGDYDAMYNVKGGTIIFVKRMLNGSRNKLFMSVAFDASEVWGLRVKRKSRPIYKSCSAVWIDLKTNNTETVIAGNGDPVYSLTENFQSTTQAKLRTQAMLQRLQRNTVEGSFMAIGRAIEAGGELKLIGTHEKEDDNTYTVKTVEHTVTKNDGWSMRVEFEN